MAISYYKLGAQSIYDDINEKNQKIMGSQIEGINLVILPHVYPSHKFRTTSFLLNSLKKNMKGKVICDMGCGPGIVGIFALHSGATRVVQADINPYAVKNAKQNNFLQRFKKDQISTYLSDCFDNIPKQIFDVIIFNIPFHCDDVEIDDPLKHAFYDPFFASTQKFLKQSKLYSNKETEIFIAFSNKGETELLEEIFEENGYNWKLWKVTNTDQQYDNRIYKLSLI